METNLTVSIIWAENKKGGFQNFENLLYIFLNVFTLKVKGITFCFLLHDSEV